eukprot:377887-Pyramimonas_sp.AAC.1
MPCGQRVRYREVGDWLIPEVECASVPPGLTDALGRARKLHAERAASAAEAAGCADGAGESSAGLER